MLRFRRCNDKCLCKTEEAAEKWQHLCLKIPQITVTIALKTLHWWQGSLSLHRHLGQFSEAGGKVGVHLLNWCCLKRSTVYAARKRHMLQDESNLYLQRGPQDVFTSCTSGEWTCHPSANPATPQRSQPVEGCNCHPGKLWNTPSNCQQDHYGHRKDLYGGSKNRGTPKSSIFKGCSI